MHYSIMSMSHAQSPDAAPARVGCWECGGVVCCRWYHRAATDAGWVRLAGVGGVGGRVGPITPCAGRGVATRTRLGSNRVASAGLHSPTDAAEHRDAETSAPGLPVDRFYSPPAPPLPPTGRKLGRPTAGVACCPANQWLGGSLWSCSRVDADDVVGLATLAGPRAAVIAARGAGLWYGEGAGAHIRASD
jgi:hypothetical protein